MLSLDNYNDASRLIDGNFDDPRLTDYELLLENLRDLKEGKDIQASCYSQRSHVSGGGGLPHWSPAAARDIVPLQANQGFDSAQCPSQVCLSSARCLGVQPCKSFLCQATHP